MFLGLLDPQQDPLVASMDPDQAPDPDPFQSLIIKHYFTILKTLNFIN
jgi:hypothetical protein